MTTTPAATMIDRRMMMTGLGLTGILPRAARAADTPISVAIALEGNRVTVAATIAGQGPFLFALDSGGVASLMDSELAHRLGLRVEAQRQLGVGGVVQPRDIVAARDLVVGGAFRIAAAQFGVMTGFGFGRDVSGSFNGGFLTTYASELAFDESAWRFWNGALPALPGYQRMPRAVQRATAGGGGASYLFAEVVVNGQSLRLALDTGAPGSLRLTKDAARRVGLDRKPSKPLMSGGKTLGMLARVDGVTMGGIDLGAPVALIRPAYGAQFPDGLIGLRLLRLLNLATDPASGDLWFKRNRLAPLGDMHGDEGL